MITLTEDQVKKLEKRQVDDYLKKLIDVIGKDNKQLPVEDTEQRFQRLRSCYDYLMSLHFETPKLIVSFLYAEAAYPGFRDAPDLKYWLDKPDTVPEKQYETFLYIMKNKLQGG